MKNLLKSQILRFTEGDPSGTPSGFSILLEVLQTSLYTSPTRFVLLCLKVRKTQPTEGLLDELIKGCHASAELLDKLNFLPLQPL